ncbi:MAG TPA: hypothetical protein VGT79_10320 [Xanthomonadaceae bacterium]|nr:hypothetical protein [Xanthomonadaceae bacterium]
MTLRCLFVDFDSCFASVEQYDDPRLRGRPVGVVPVVADSTCCLAASYEAKAVGVKTGTGVREAREKCPEIRLVLARPARYIELHHLLMRAIEDCIPHAKPLSVDEVPCYLIGRERKSENAEAIARSINQRLVDLGFSPAINCSIGIAPNRFLAKTASDTATMPCISARCRMRSRKVPHRCGSRSRRFRMWFWKKTPRRSALRGRLAHRQRSRTLAAARTPVQGLGRANASRDAAETQTT